MRRRQFILSALGIPFYLPIMEGLLSRDELQAAEGDPQSFMITLRNGCGRSKNFWQADNGAIVAAKIANTSVAPLTPYISKLLFVDKLQHSVSNNGGGKCSHGISASCLLSGGNFNPGGGNGLETSTVQSLDYYVHKKFGGTDDPLYIQVGTLSGKSAKISWSGNGQEVARITNPYETYKKLFTLPPTKSSGGGSTGASTGPDPSLVLKRGVLDSVLEQIKTLKNNPRLSADDLKRLDQHLAAVNSYEGKLKTLIANSSGTGSSSKKMVASDKLVDALNARNGKNGNDWGDQQLISQLHMESIALALANGNTRVATMSMGVSIDMIGYKLNGVPNDFHNTSHINEYFPGNFNPSAADNAKRYAQLDAHDKFFAEQFKFLLDKINEIPVSGGGSYLDYGVAMWLCDMGPHAHEWSPGDGGRGHDQQNLMHVVAGGGKLGLKQGQKIDLDNMVMNRFLATIGNAIGVQGQDGAGVMTSFNADAGKAAAQATNSGGKSLEFKGIIPQMRA